MTDCDVTQGKIKIDKARVGARDKDRTKTSEDRIVELCPRALHVLKRQLAIWARLKLEGKINHEDLCFKDDGAPIRNLQYPWARWRRTLTVTLKGRYREPYNARHSSVTWNLMIGKNPLGCQATWPQRADHVGDIRCVARGVRLRPTCARFRTRWKRRSRALFRCHFPQDPKSCLFAVYRRS